MDSDDLAKYVRRMRNYREQGLAEADWMDSNKEYCRVNSPLGSWICTKERGHVGRHVAHFDNGMLCCAPWPQHRRAR